MPFYFSRHLAKGSASFIAGQLIDKTPLTLELVFQIFAGFCAVAATIFYIIYLIVGRRLEKELLEELAKQQPQEDTQIEKFARGYTPDPFAMTTL